MIDSFRGKYAFLSNFYDFGKCEFEGVVYPTSEHAYQAAKCFNDEDRTAILNARTPGEAKRLGRRVKIISEWEIVKVDAMRDIVASKFGRNTRLRDQLLATGDEELVEGNNWGDTFWGQVNGVGENWLGKILMETREKF